MTSRMQKSRNTKRGCIGGMVSNLNLYGQDSVSLNAHVTTRLPSCIGTSITIISMIFMLSLTVNRTLKLVSKDDPFFSTISEDYDETVYLGEKLNFMFAIANIDPRAGLISATQTYIGSSVERVNKEIQLVDCDELLPGGSY